MRRYRNASLSFRKAALAFLITLYLTTPSVFAATLYWDAGGGTLTNWTELTNWDISPDGTGGNPAVAPGASDIAYFNILSLESAQNAYLAANLSIQGFVFNSIGTTTIRTSGANRTITLGIGGISINAGAGVVTFGTTTANFRIGFTLGGSQTWLNDSANTLTLNNNNTIALGANTLTVDGAGNITTGTGAISGTGGIIKNGVGTLTLSAANTFTTGGITLNAGTLMLGNNAALGGAASVFTINGGTINVNAARTTANNNNQVWNGDFTFAGANTLSLGSGTVSLGTAAGTSRTITVNASTLTVGGVISDGTTANNLIKMGSGILTLNGANAYTGGTTISEGVLSIGVTTALPGFGTGGSYSVASGAALAVGNSVADGDITTMLGTGNFAAGASMGFDTTAGNRTYTSGVADTSAGALGLVKIGINTLTLSGANTYTGVTTIRAGTLQFAQETSLYNNTQASWTDANIVVESGTTAIFNAGGAGEFTAGDIDILAALGTSTGGFKTGAILGLDTTGGDFAYSSAIANPNGGANTRSLTKFGVNTLTLSGANSYTGPTTVGEGTLALSGAGALADTSAVNVTGGTAVFDISGITASSETIGSLAGVSGSSAVLGGKNLTAGDDNTSTTFAGVISGTGGSLTKTGTGTLTLTAANTYTGATDIKVGGMTLSGAGQINFSSDITIYTGSTLTLNNGAAVSIDRILDTAPLTANGGTFAWTHTGAAGINYAETIGALTNNVGHFKMTASQAAVGQTSTVTFDSLTRNTGSSALFSGTGLGDNLQNQVFFTVAPTLSNLIIPGTIVQRGTVYDLAGYTAGAGLHAFGTQAGEVYDNATANPGWGAATNARPSATVTGINANKSLNSLVLDNGVNLDGSSLTADRTITFAGASTILQTGGTSSNTVNGTSEYIFAFGSTQAKFHTVGTNIINRGNATNLTGTGGLVKSGAGVLLLKASSSMTGNYYINEGFLVVTNALALGGTGNIVELNGGSLNLYHSTGTDFVRDVRINGSQGLGAINLSGTYGATGIGGATHTLGKLTLGTSTQDQTIQVRTAGTPLGGGAYADGNRVFNLTFDSVTLNGNGTFDIADRGTGEGLLTITGPIDDGAGGAAPFSVTKTSNGTLVLNSGANNWTGTTSIIGGGALRLGASGNLPSGNLILNGGWFGSLASFTRDLGTGVNQVQLPGGISGFTAVGTGITNSIGGIGTPTALTWGTSTFDPTALLLGDTEQTATLTFANPISLNTATATERKIQVDATGTTAARSVMTGNISGTGSLYKAGGGVLELTGTLSYDGTTRVDGGTLRVASPASLPSGNLYLQAGNSTAVLETSGTFNRALGAGANEVRLVGNSTTGNPRPGFSAVGGDLTVNLGGSGATLTWDTTFFDPNGLYCTNSGGLYLQTLNATGLLTFQNNIDLNGNLVTGRIPFRRFSAANSITNTGTRAVITGVISDTGASPVGFQKRDAGLLVLAPTSANTYTGTNLVSHGTLAAVDNYGISGANLWIAPSANDERPNFAPQSPTFTRALGTDAGQVQLSSPGALTGTESGFTAYGQDVIIDLGGPGGPEIQWGNAAGTFSPNILLLNEGSADHKLTLANGLDLNNASANRQISVRSVTPSDATAAEIIGNIRNTAGSFGVTKSAAGLLILSGANTYSGPTTINAGVLRATVGVGLPTTSNLVLTGGVFETSGTFDWALGSAAQNVRVTGSGGGFSAAGASDLIVNLGGASGLLTYENADWFPTAGANTLILNAASANHNLDFQNPMDLNTNNVTARTRTIQVDAQTATFSGVLSNSGAAAANLTKTGTGTLVLGNAANAYKGVTTVSAGTLITGADAPSDAPGALGNAVSDVLMGNTSGALDAVLLTGGAFTVGRGITVQSGNTGVITLGGSTAGASTYIGAITLGTASGTAKDVTLVALAGGSVEFSGAINENTSVPDSSVTIGDATHTGTVKLSGANQYGGITTVANGATLDVTDLGTTGGSSVGNSARSDAANLILSGGTFRYTGVGETTTRLFTFDANGATVDASGGAAIIFTGDSLAASGAGSRTLALAGATTDTNTMRSVIVDPGSGSTSLTKSGAGTWVLSGANSYTGVTTINGGRLTISANTGLGTVAAGTTINAGALELDGSLGALTIGAEALAINGTGISEGGALRNLSGNNSYGGVITLVGSAVRINSDANTLTLFSGSAITGDFGLTLGGAGNIVLSDAFAPVTTGQTLTKDGAGTATLSGNNTYTSGTIINDGTLRLGAADRLADAGAVTVAKGTFDLANNNETIAALNMGGVTGAAAVTTGSGTLTLGGNVALDATGNPSGASISGKLDLGGATRTFNVGDSSGATDDLTVSAAISAASTYGLAKTGAGVLVLSGNNTFDGKTAINGGTVKISSEGNLGTTPGSAVADQLSLAGGTLQNAASFSLSANRGITLGSGGGTFKTDSSTTLTVASDITGSGDLSKSGMGRLIITSASTTSGGLNINAGTLILTNANGSLTSITNVNVNPDGALVLNNTAVANNGNRLNDAAPIYLNATSGNISAFKFLNDAATGSNYTETLGALYVTGSAGTAEITTSQAESTGSSVLTFTSLTKSDGTTLSFMGLGLGDDIRNRILFTVAPTLVGGIIPGATVNVFDSASYSDTLGIIPLAVYDTTYTTNYPGAGNPTGWTSATVNANPDGPVKLDANVAINSLKLTHDEYNAYLGTGTIGNPGILDLNGKRLVLVSGTLRSSGTNGAPDSQIQTVVDTAGGGSLTAGDALGGGSGSIDLTVITATGNTLTNSAVISDNNSQVINLVKAGPGILVLASTNTFTGPVSVNGGTLKISSGNDRIPVAAAVTLADTAGVVLDLDGNNQAIASLTGGGTAGGNVTLGAGTLTVGDANSTNYAGVISGSGAVTKQGSGAWTLSGTNTYGGTTTVGAGTLRLGATNIIPDGSGKGNVSVTGTLDLNTFNETINGLTGAGTVDTVAGGTPTLTVGNNNASSTFSGVIQNTAGTLALTKTGAGTLTLSGANTYSGTTTVGAGTLQLGAANVIPDGSGKGNVSVTGTLDLNGFSETINGLTGAGTVDTVAGGTPTLTVGANDQTSAFGGVIQNTAGALALTKTGAGALTLSGVNTYSGGTTLSAGQLNVNSTTALGAGALTIFGTSTLDNTSGAALTLANNNAQNWNADFTFEGLDGGTHDLNLGTGAVTPNANRQVTVNAGNLTVGGIIGGGAITLTKAGAGTLTLSGANTYSGLTTVNAGILKVGNAAGLGDTAAGTIVASDAVLDLNGQAIGAEAVNISGTGIGSTGALINSSATAASLAGVLTLDLASSIGVIGNITLSAGLAGSQSLTKEGAGTLILQAAATRAGTATLNTTINGGKIRIENATAMSTGTTHATIINSGTILELANGITLDQPISLNDGGTVRSDGSNAENGKITVQNTGTPSVTFATASVSDILTLGNGDNDLTGGVAGTTLNISGPGVVLIGGDSGPTHNIIGTWTVASGSTLRIQRGTDALLGNVANGVILNGGTFSLLANSDFNPVTNRVFTLGASGGTIEVGSGRIITFDDANQLTGLGSLTKTGAGTNTISAAQNYGGNTFINGGFLQAGDTSALSAGNITFGGGALQYTANTASTDWATRFKNSTSAVALDTGGQTVTLAGIIDNSNTGGLTKSGSGTLTLSGANTYTGVTTLSLGTVNLGIAESAGVSGPLGNSIAANPGSIVFSGGTLQYSAVNQNDYSGRFSTAANQGYNVDTAGQNITWAANLISLGGTLTKSGAGKLTLPGVNTYTGVTTINGGILAVTGSLNNGAGTTSIGSAAGTKGMLYVPAGGSYVTTAFTVGSNTNGVGSIVINGGTVATTTPTITLGLVSGNGGYGGFFMSGGSFSTRRFDGGTSLVPTAVSVNQISGGMWNNSEYILLRNALSEFTMTGGTVDHSGASNPIAVGELGTAATLTVAGGLLNNTGQSVAFGRIASSVSFATLNLDAGTLLTANIAATAGNIIGAGAARVNFNGGTLKASASSATFLPSGVTAAYVNGAFGSFTGGAVVDDNGFAITFAEPLLAPGGNGVSGLTLNNAGSGYIGSPYVEITGGGGTGATGYAVVDLDPDSLTFGQLTGVVLSNPGVDYTGTPTINLIGGGGTGADVTASGTAANTSGGLTKNGYGSLTLIATNTYAGATLVNAGSLVLGSTSDLGGSYAPLGTNTLTLAGSASSIGPTNILDQSFLDWLNNRITALHTGAVVMAVGSSSDLAFTGANLTNAFLGGAYATPSIFSGAVTNWGDGGGNVRLGGGAGWLTYAPAIGSGTNVLIGPVNGNPLSVVQLTASNDLDGPIIVQSGSLFINNITNFALGAPGNGLILTNGGGLRSSNNFFLNRVVTLAAGGGVIGVDAGSTLYVTGQISGTSLTKVGVGTLMMLGAPSYTGGTFITNGVFSIGNEVNAGGVNKAINFVGGTLQVRGTNMTSLDNMVVNWTNSTAGNGFNGGLDINNDGNTFFITNNIISDGALTKSGNGLLVLSGDNAGLQRLVVSGPLLITNSTALAGGSNVVLSGGSLQLGSNVVTAPRLFVISGNGTGPANFSNKDGALRSVNGINTNSGTIILAAAARIRANADSQLYLEGVITNAGYLLTFAGFGEIISRGGIYGTGGILKERAATVTLENLATNAYGNTSIEAGALQLDYGAGASIVSNLVAPNSVLSLGAAGFSLTTGGTLIVNGPSVAGGAITQSFASVTIQAGNNAIIVNTNKGSVFLNLGTNIVRAVGGGILDLTLPGGSGGITTALSNNYAGLLSSNSVLVTIDNTDWAMATNVGGSLSKITNYDGYTSVAIGNPMGNESNTNVRIGGTTAGAVTLGAAVTSINTLAVTNTAATTNDLVGQTLRLGQTGGILLTPTSGGLTIGTNLNDGFLTAGGGYNDAAGELVFINNSANALTVNSALASNGTGALTVTINGNGAVNFAGNNNFNRLYVNSGTNVTFSNTNIIYSASPLTIRGGTVTLLETSTNLFVGGHTYINAGALNINGPVTFGIIGGASSTSNSLVVGSGTDDRGVVSVMSNVVVSYQTLLGNAALSAGALYQGGGVYSNVSSVYIGSAAGGYGYMGLTDGTFISIGQTRVSSAGVGVTELFGGTLESAGVIMSRSPGGVGVLNVLGGRFAVRSTGVLTMGYNDASGGLVFNTITVKNGALDLATGSTSKILDMGFVPTAGAGATGIVNVLSGGLLVVNKIGATRQGATFLNFDGGTLKANPGTTVGTTFMTNGLAGAYIYSGGATIDSDTNVIAIAQPLLAPVGYGLTNIVVSRPGEGYIGAPAVIISGGSGTGATAIAQMDLIAGTITNILITSMGSGYLSNDALNITLLGGGFSRPADIGAFTFGQNVSDGGLIKTGMGTLILSGANTYGGGTRINQGAVRFATDNAVPGSGWVIVNSGAAVSLGTDAVNSVLLPRVAQYSAGALGLLDTNVSENIDFNGNAGGQPMTNLILASASNLTYAGTYTPFQLGGVNQYRLGAFTNRTFTFTNAITDGQNGGAAGAIVEINKGGSLLSGAVVLGTNNTYTGGTFVYGGALMLMDESGQFGSGPVSLNNGNLVFNNSNILTLNNNVTGGGAVIMMGTGWAILNGINTYGGGSFVTNGFLVFNTTNALPGSSSVYVDYTGAVGLNTNDIGVNAGINDALLPRIPQSSAGALGLLETNVADNVDFSGAAGGQPMTNLILAGATNLTYTGAYTPFAIAGTNVYHLGAFTNATFTIPVLLTNNAGGSGVLLVGTTNILLGGTVALTGANTYSNGTYLLGGTLNINADGALGSAPLMPTTNVTFVSSATLQFAVSMNLDANRAFSPMGGTGTFDTLANTVVIPGNITGDGSINKIGSGTLILNNNTDTVQFLTVNTGTLWLSNTLFTATGVFANGAIIVGDSATDNNAALIVDTNSVVGTTAGVNTPFTVGNYGSGNTLIVTNGGVVYAGTTNYPGFWMGNQVGSSSNLAIVIGTNSLIASGGRVLVGDDGSFNTMLILDGGTVSNANYFEVGRVGTASNNLLVVSGEGSLLTNSSTGIIIGESGVGNMAIFTNGARGLTAGAVILGYGVGSHNNTLEIIGTNTVVSAVGEVQIGGGGTIRNGGPTNNTLMILDGGALINANWVTAGRFSNASDNLLLVSGEGALLSNTVNGIIVGNFGRNNTAIITNSAHVVTLGRFILGYALSGNNNSLYVGGTGSVLNVASHIQVGTNGTSNLMVVGNGASVTGAAIFVVGAASSADNNTVIITDTGTVVSIASELRVGELGSSNTTMILTGATVNLASWVQVGRGAGAADNLLLVSGEGAWLNNTAAANGIIIGNSGASSVAIITNSARVNAPRLALGFTTTSTNNSVFVGGAGTLLQIGSGGIQVGNDGSFNTMSVGDGATVTNTGSLQIGSFNFTSNNMLTISGANTRFYNGGETWLGATDAHHNVIQILDGAEMTNTSFFLVGRRAGADNNTLIVDNASLYNGGNALAVGGGAGIGNVGIFTNSARVLALEFNVGRGTGGTNNVAYIGGTGTLLRVTGANGIQVGRGDAYNSLYVGNGAVVTNAGVLFVGASAIASNNLLQITGAGSRFWVGGDATLGESAASLVEGNQMVLDSGATGVISGNLTVSTNSVLRNLGTAAFHLGGNFDNLSTNFAQNNFSGTFIFSGTSGAEVRTQQVEVASARLALADMGTTNFAYGAFQVGDPLTGSNAYVQLADDR
ncbi:MAG: autotransporter-associated beta strand repeat-containing protein, partial [Verrucomicrobiia bacterium]